MSYASEHPVRCARTDLGCTASFPGGKHAAIEACRAGWFESRQRCCWYCPDHLPDWVPEWRARQREAASG